jgi:hypothetical protein
MTLEERASLDALTKLWARLREHFYVDGRGDLEEYEFFEFAETAGLMEMQVYDPVAHGDMHMLGDLEPGDSVYVLSRIGKALLRDQP